VFRCLFDRAGAAQAAIKVALGQDSRSKAPKGPRLRDPSPAPPHHSNSLPHPGAWAQQKNFSLWRLIRPDKKRICKNSFPLAQSLIRLCLAFQGFANRLTLVPNPLRPTGLFIKAMLSLLDVKCSSDLFFTSTLFLLVKLWSWFQDSIFFSRCKACRDAISLSPPSQPSEKGQGPRIRLSMATALDGNNPPGMRLEAKTHWRDWGNWGLAYTDHQDSSQIDHSNYTRVGKLLWE
jgi:hypothetical protein